MHHRREIDGLRAIAVLPVVLFHAGFAPFKGGFVGVDIFFVISGYLITGIITADLDAGRFSLLNFYERRARRILPALFTVLAVCSPFAFLWLLPEDRRAFAESIAAVALFASNFLFWSQTGYFDTAAELKPLLHTWSLAVEEQYYLLFPLFMMFAWRFGRRTVAATLLVVMLASLALAEWGAMNRPSAAFFLLPTRAWELLVGALMALYLRSASVIEAGLRFRNAMSFAGLLLIVAAVFLFDRSTPVPGLSMLVPTMGAAAIILCGAPDTWTGRLLSSRPLVGIGLVSYSAYLWHQPLFTLARHRIIDDPGAGIYAALCFLVFVLAYVTWRFVEQPFRDRSRVSRPSVFRFSAATTAVFLAAGAATAGIVRDEVSRETTGGRCNAGVADCFPVSGARFHVALWGDSYADAFSESLAKSLARHGISLHLFIKHSCPSLVGTMRNEPRRLGVRFADDCETHNAATLRSLREQRFDYVVVTSAYHWYLTARNDEGQPILVDKTHPELPPEAFLSARLRETLLEASVGKGRVLAVMPHPVVKDFRRARKALFFGVSQQEYADFDEATRIRSLLVSGLDGVPFDEVDGRKLLCVNTSCPIVDGGHLRLYDGSHISSVVSGPMADEITKVILLRLGRGV